MPVSVLRTLQFSQQIILKKNFSFFLIFPEQFFFFERGKLQKFGKLGFSCPGLLFKKICLWQSKSNCNENQTEVVKWPKTFVVAVRNHLYCACQIHRWWKSLARAEKKELLLDSPGINLVIWFLRVKILNLSRLIEAKI